jgi:sugar transferase (PEP-CTERM/EpsH1 system associated)
MVRLLSERGYRVHLRHFADDTAPMDPGPLARWCASIEAIDVRPTAARLRAAAALVRGTCLTDAYFDERRMRMSVEAAFRATGARCAVGYSSAVAQFVPAMHRSRSMMELADLDSAKFEHYARDRSAPGRWMYAVEAGRLRRREIEIVRDFGLTTLVSARERELLRSLSTASVADRTIVLKNGVDVDFFGAHPGSGDLPEGFAAGGGPRLVFTGVMDYAPNVEAVEWFAREVFPMLRRRHVMARFAIVGNRPVPRVRRLADVEGIAVTGFVPDVRPYLGWADCCIVPLQLARGVQNKALEAMAAGRPVIVSPQAHEGVGAADGVHYLVADAPAAYLSAIDRLWREPGYAQGIGGAGRAFVIEHHSWDACLQPMIDFVARERGA